MLNKLTVITILLLLVSVVVPSHILADDVIEINFFGLSGVFVDVDAQFVEEFNQRHEGQIRVNHDFGWHEQLMTQIVAGYVPDVLAMQSWTWYNFYSDGLLRDLTSFLERNPMIAEVMHPASFQRGEVDGRLYTLALASASANQFLAFYYNPRLFAEAGLLEPPKHPDNAWSWVEFVDTATKLTEMDADGNPLIWGFDMAGHGSRITALLHTFDAWYWNPDLKQLDFASEQGARTVEAYQDLVHRYRVAPAAGEPNGGRGGFQNSTVGMFIDGSWLPRTNWPDLIPDSDWSVAVMPVGEGATDPSTMSWGDNIGVTTLSRHPQIADLFLKEYIYEMWSIEELGRFGQFDRFPERFAEENKVLEDFVVQYARPWGVFPFNDALQFYHEWASIINRVRSAGDVTRYFLIEEQERLNNLITF